MAMRRLLLVVSAFGAVAALMSAQAALAADSGPVSRLVHLSVAVSTTTDGDPVVEPNEQFTFTVQIRNIGSTTATGITATLVPNGWPASQSTSGFPDIPPGGTASNTTPFSGTNVFAACGGQLNARLNISSQDGTHSVPVTIPMMGVLETSAFNSTQPVAIPDLGTVDVPLVVPSGTGPVMDVDVRIGELRYAWDEDLFISLRPPDWTGGVNLSIYEGLGPDFLGTVFDDEATTYLWESEPPFTGRFLPDSGVTLAAVDGYQAAGTWHLRIRDDVSGDSGQLNSWGFDLTTVKCNTPPTPSFQTVPAEAKPGQAFEFRSTSSDDRTIVSHEWDLDNDGAFDDATGPIARKAFAQVGSYRIGLRVIDDGQNAASTTEDVFVAKPRTTAARVCRVPRVVRRTLAAARTAIRRAGCRVGRVRRARSRARSGRVIRQSPRAGLRRARGTRVNLTVSRGR
jgi:uncharacterized repeat protein (TIGR01451 family)